MARLSTKLRSVAFDINRECVGIAHWCPGCNSSHAVCTKGDATKGPFWQWDGSVSDPTLLPSIRISVGGSTICHYNLKQGMLKFHEDSTHILSGQTINLPDWPECDDDESSFYLNPPHDFNLLQ